MMKKHNYNEVVMNNLKTCGVITCIHHVGGLCNKCDGCELFERTLCQES